MTWKEIAVVLVFCLAIPVGALTGAWLARLWDKGRP